MLKKILINTSLKRATSFSLNQFNKQCSSVFNNNLKYLNKSTKFKLSDYQINLIYQNKINYQIIRLLTIMAPNNTTTINEKTLNNNDDIICKFGILTDAQYANIPNRPGNLFIY